MKKLEWTKNMELGIPVIDNQHKMLLNIIVKLIEANKQHRNKYIIEEIIDEMEIYYNYHTKFEETFQTSINYSSVLHLREHGEFKLKIKQCRAKVHIDNNLSDEILDFLIQYFYNHTLNMDREMIQYFLNVS